MNESSLTILIHRGEESAQIGMCLLAAPRNERWPNDLAIDRAFGSLIDELIQTIVDAYSLPSLAQDKTLRGGLITTSAWPA